MNDYSEILFARPSFAEGVGRLVDFGDTLTEFNSAETPEQADTRALASDWYAIGSDIRAAIRRFANNITTDATDAQEA